MHAFTTDITLLHLDTFTWETVKLHDRGVGFSPRFGHSITHTSINVKHITGFARQQASKAAMPSSSLPSMFPSASSLNGQHNDDDSEDDANAHLVVLQGGNDIRIGTYTGVHVLPSCPALLHIVDVLLFSQA